MYVFLVISALIAIAGSIIFINLTTKWRSRLLGAWLGSYVLGMFLAFTAIYSPQAEDAYLLVALNGTLALLVLSALVSELSPKKLTPVVPQITAIDEIDN